MFQLTFQPTTLLKLGAGALVEILLEEAEAVELILE
jgi:hypothetical protein